MKIMHQNREYIIQQRDRLLSEMPNIDGVGRFRGGTASNFLLVEICDKQNKPSNEVALQVYERLAESRGVVVRFRGKELGCLGCLRVTVGTEREVTRFLKELSSVLKDIHADRQSEISKPRKEVKEQAANDIVA